MSWTKNFYHDEINHFLDDHSEEEWFEAMEAQDETEIDWFDDFRLAHDGYSETDSFDFDGELIDDLPF